MNITYIIKDGKAKAIVTGLEVFGEKAEPIFPLRFTDENTAETILRYKELSAATVGISNVTLDAIDDRFREAASLRAQGRTRPCKCDVQSEHLSAVQFSDRQRSQMQGALNKLDKESKAHEARAMATAKKKKK